MPLAEVVAVPATWLAGRRLYARRIGDGGAEVAEVARCGRGARERWRVAAVVVVTDHRVHGDRRRKGAPRQRIGRLEVVQRAIAVGEIAEGCDGTRRDGAHKVGRGPALAGSGIGAGEVGVSRRTTDVAGQREHRVGRRRGRGRRWRWRWRRVAGRRPDAGVVGDLGGGERSVVHGDLVDRLRPELIAPTDHQRRRTDVCRERGRRRGVQRPVDVPAHRAGTIERDDQMRELRRRQRSRRRRELAVVALEDHLPGRRVEHEVSGGRRRGPLEHETGPRVREARHLGPQLDRERSVQPHRGRIRHRCHPGRTVERGRGVGLAGQRSGCAERDAAAVGTWVSETAGVGDDGGPACLAETPVAGGSGGEHARGVRACGGRRRRGAGSDDGERRREHRGGDGPPPRPTDDRATRARAATPNREVLSCSSPIAHVVHLSAVPATR